MNIMEAIENRHSYRGRYAPAPVPREHLIEIMRAGLAAPSGCNKQTTSLIAVDDPAVLEKLHSVIQPPIGETAPAMICVLTRRINAYRDKCFAVQDYAAAIENMLLAIVALGYQSCWIEGHITDDDRIGERMAAILGVPEGYELVCFLPVGVAEDEVAPPLKKAFGERAWFNRFPGEEHIQWWHEKGALVKEYRQRNRTAEKGGVVFTGSSLMEMFPVEQWVAELPAPRPAAYNRGVSGYTTMDLMPILDICVWELMPKKVFINIGTNDMNDPAASIDGIMARYDRIITEIEAHLPGVRIYMMAYYPVNPDAAIPELKACLEARSNERIRAANDEVKKLAERHGQRYVDVNAPITDGMGRLRSEYTLEGMHINADGYRAVFDALLPYILED